MLDSCLGSLLNQSVPSKNFHVLIVDNNSTDNTKDVANSFLGRLSLLRIVNETNQGLGHARNRSVAEAATNWIAFLDDDAKAHPNWIETILAVIEKDDFDCFGGPYYAWQLFGPPPDWLPESFGTYEGQQGYGPLDEAKAHIPGGNCAISVAAVRAVGAFPVDFGMTGEKCMYGEETLLFHRMRQAGFRLGYVPAMKIDHCVLPHKYSFRWQVVSAFASSRDWHLIMGEVVDFRRICSVFLAVCRVLFVDSAKHIYRLCTTPAYRLKSALLALSVSLAREFGRVTAYVSSGNRK